MKTKFFLFAALIFAAQAMSQDFKVRHIKTDPEAFPQMVSAVQVYDTFDEPVADLKNENFGAAVDAQRSDSVRAITYKEAGRSFHIMLCMDISGTMQGTPLETIKKSLIKFIDDMRSIDKIAVMTIADDPVLLADFSNDKQYLKDKVEAITAQGKESAIYYSVYKGIKKLIDVKEKTGKILLLMSDGKNESSSASHTEDDAIHEANSDGIPIFSIGYTKIARSHLRSLERMSEKTGGNYYDSPTDDDLDKCYQKLYRQILNIYLLNYMTGVRADGGEHAAVVSVNYKGLNKSVSSKFLAPAGMAQNKEAKIIKSESTSIPIWVYVAAGLVLAGGIAAVVIIMSRRKKKKEEDERRRRDEENRRKEEQAEKLRQAKDADAAPKSRKFVEAKDEKMDRPAAEKTAAATQRRSDKTMILSPGAAGTKLGFDVEVGTLQGSHFEASASGATMGRAADNTIILNDSTVSGRHARVTCDAGIFMIEDLGSTNGTFVNGQKITIQRLNPGDTLKLGSCEGRITQQ